MPKYSVNRIFKMAYPSFERSCPLPVYKRRAANKLRVCRTAALGGHVESCPDGHYTRIWYNSCKHRSCPQCRRLSSEQWLQKQEDKILNFGHFHAVFTLPSELRFLLRHNYKLLASLMFKASTEVVFQLSMQKHGLMPGIIAAFHTWTKTLLEHPHIHLCISACGLDKDKQFKRIKGSYLFKVQIVQSMFKGKMRELLIRAQKDKKLILSHEMTDQQFLNLLNKLGRKKWNTDIQNKYEHAKGVISYFSRYLRGGPISNNRILNATKSHVTFNYGRENNETMTIKTTDFINRYLNHIPPERSILIRHYGLYNPAKKIELNIAKKALNQPTLKASQPLTWNELYDQFDKARALCPHCKQPLIITKKVQPTPFEERNHSPPAYTINI